MEIEEAVKNNEKELGDKIIEEVKEDAAPQINENNEADKDKDEAKENISKGEDNDKDKETDKAKEDVEKNEEDGNKDDTKEEKKK